MDPSSMVVAAKALNYTNTSPAKVAAPINIDIQEDDDWRSVYSKK